jgi:hypothetical protein
VSTQDRIRQIADDITEPVRVYPATLYRWVPPQTIPLRDWLYGKLLARKFVSATVGPGGTLKTSKAVSETLAMVTGRSLLGVKPARQLRVWFLNLEDPHAEDLQDRLYVDSGRDRPLIIGRPSGRGVEIDRDTVDPFIAEIQRRKIDVVIVDPFVSSHKVPENDNGSIDTIVKEFGRIADAGNCAVELIHHTRKGSDGEATAENARGGRSFIDACRSVRVVNAMTSDEGKRAGVDNNRLFFRISTDKANMVAPAESANWMQVASVGLGNGTNLRDEDRIGVATPWRWPDHTEGVGSDQKSAVIAVVQSGSWRADSQAKDWVGKAVAQALGLDLSASKDTAKAKALLKKWVEDGTLRVVEKHDDRRNVRKFIEVASDA